MPLVLRAGAEGDEGGSGEGAAELAAARFVFLCDCDGDSNGDSEGDGDGAESAESPVARQGGRRVLHSSLEVLGVKVFEYVSPVQWRGCKYVELHIKMQAKRAQPSACTSGEIVQAVVQSSEPSEPIIVARQVLSSPDRPTAKSSDHVANCKVR